MHPRSPAPGLPVPKRRRSSGLARWLSVMLVGAAMVVPVDGKEIFLGGRVFQPGFNGGGQEEVDASQVAEFPTGATLPTDTEIDRVLKRADEYVMEGRYDLAVVVWQKVLDGTTSVLRSTDGRHYTSVQGYVEEQLARLARAAPQGLKEYRLKADGEARELIAQASGSDEEQSLSAVVRRFFYSSLGDDAAYTLGCLMLDRHEFVAATRLFTNILVKHPDYIAKTDSPPSVPKAQVWLRLAVSAARSGDGRTARVALEELEKVGIGADSEATIAWVNRIIDDGGGGAIQYAGTAPGQWHGPLGTPARDGQMTGLAADTAYRGVWREQWVKQFNDQKFGLTNTTAAPSSTAGPFDSRRQSLKDKWQTSDWLPADSLLMDEGRIYFRAYDQVVCVQADTGRIVFYSSKVSPQVQPFQTSTAEEVMLFGDRASNSMSIHEGVLYYLEEDPSGHMQQNQTYHRSRTGISAMRPRLGSRIVALDARSGKKLWQTESEPDEAGSRRPVRYQSAPVAYGNLLLAPVIDGGALWLYARRADRNGELAWKTFLADDPPGGHSPWVTTGLSIAGGDAYVVSGGVVFNVEATGGLVRWASRYHRDLSGAITRRNYGNQPGATANGWDDDVIIPHGRFLIVAAHDRDAIMALDRRTGRLLWETPREGATHILGTQGRFLYVAGRDVLRKYDMQGGLLVASPPMERVISGRGFVADDAIYLPVRDAVARYDLKTLKEISIVGVTLPIPDSDGRFNYSDPVGNLYSDGQRLFAVALESVYAIGAVERPASSPAGVTGTATGEGVVPALGRHQTGDPNVDVLLDHGIEPTSESLAKYLTDLHPTAQVKAMVDRTIRQLGDNDYHRREEARLALLAMAIVPVEALTAAKDHSPDPEVRDAAGRIFAATDGKRARVLFAALSTIRKKQIQGLTSQTLAAAPLCNQQYLLDALTQALKATVAEADGPVLRKAMAHESPAVRAAVIPALAASQKEKALDDLKALGKDGDARVRLAAARALADMGDRASLALLADLLDDQDVIIRSGAARILTALTAQKIAFVPYDDAEKRKVAAQAWRAWINGAGQSAQLQFPLEESRFLLGRTLISNYRTGRVVELDSQGKEIWSVVVANPWGVHGLPNGHRLVTSYTQRTVTEFDAKGDKVWEQTNLPAAPFGVERLENGNTLVACSNSNRVVEVDPNNKVVWDITILGRPTEAIRLPNGRTLIALQNGNRIVEVNHEGKEEWKIDNLMSPIAAQRLPNGNTLVAEVSGNRVRELDPQGKEVWSVNRIGGQVLRTPYSAHRLDNGNTLIADNSGLREVDAKGDKVWERLEVGISKVSRY